MTNRDSNKIIGFLAFVAVVCVAIALFVASLVTAPNTIRILNRIATIASHVVILITSFIYVYNRRSMVYWIIWGAAIVLFVLGGYIL